MKKLLIYLLVGFVPYLSTYIKGSEENKAALDKPPVLWGKRLWEKTQALERETKGQAAEREKQEKQEIQKQIDQQGQALAEAKQKFENAFQSQDRILAHASLDNTELAKKHIDTAKAIPIASIKQDYPNLYQFLISQPGNQPISHTLAYTPAQINDLINSETAKKVKDSIKTLTPLYKQVNTIQDEINKLEEELTHLVENSKKQALIQAIHNLTHRHQDHYAESHLDDTLQVWALHIAQDIGNLEIAKEWLRACPLFGIGVLRQAKELKKQAITQQLETQENLGSRYLGGFFKSNTLKNLEGDLKKMDEVFTEAEWQSWTNVNNLHKSFVKAGLPHTDNTHGIAVYMAQQAFEKDKKEAAQNTQISNDFFWKSAAILGGVLILLGSVLYVSSLYNPAKEPINPEEANLVEDEEPLASESGNKK